MDVLAAIAVFGKNGGEARKLADPCLHRERKIDDLRPAIVVIELAVHALAL